ncbi:hypothetical protein FOA52_013437 [Chlamydomonas sp. UWO 241]|nr:hypothetical protein FOA52_013437 [Chlamydomonas sp. UWO 241]
MLEHLTMDYCDAITDLAPLQHLPQLLTLNLVDCSSITDLAPLRSLPNLRKVHITDYAANNRAVLDDISGLVVVDDADDDDDSEEVEEEQEEDADGGESNGEGAPPGWDPNRPPGWTPAHGENPYADLVGHPLHEWNWWHYQFM